LASLSSRVTVGDLARLPCLMKAPCPHCEQTKIRGSVADVAPTWPQFGQMIRVSMSVASAGAGAQQEQVWNFPQLQSQFQTSLGWGSGKLHFE
jgi:hypothetical protein